MAAAQGAFAPVCFCFGAGFAAGAAFFAAVVATGFFAIGDLAFDVVAAAVAAATPIAVPVTTRADGTGMTSD